MKLFIYFFIDQEITAKFTSLKRSFFANYKKVESTSASGAGTNSVFVPTWPHFDRMFFVRDSSIPNPTLSTLDIEHGIFEPTLKTPMTPNNNINNMDYGKSMRTPLTSMSSSNITPVTSNENGFNRIADYNFLPSTTSYSKRKKVNNLNPLHEAAIHALTQMDKEPKIDKIGAICVIMESNLRSLPSDNDVDICFTGWQQFFFDYKNNIHKP